MNLMEKVRARAEVERGRLASGEKPAPRMANKTQRTAARALAAFFGLMLAFTLLARASSGITTARVETTTGITGVLTQRTELSGTLQAQGDLEFTLPAGIRVTGIPVTIGQRVKAGQTLLELDTEGLDAATQKLQGELALLDLKIAAAATGRSGDSADGILKAKTDYTRKLADRDTCELRGAEDLAQAQADCDKASAALEQAHSKAKEDLVKAAQEKLDAAKEALLTTQESAKEANDSAQQALEAAQDQQSNADGPYYSAIGVYNRAEEAVKAVQRELDGLAAAEPPDAAAIAAAQAALDQAKTARDQAQSTMDSLSNSGDAAYRAVTRASENVKITKEKWAEKVKKAEAAVTVAEGKLTEAKNKTDMSGEVAVIAAQGALDGAERALVTARRSTQDQSLAAQRAVDDAQTALAQAQRTDGTGKIDAQQAEIDRLGYVNDRREAQKKLDELLAANAAGGKLMAPADGTVLFVPAETGLTTESGKVASLSRNGESVQFTGKLAQKDAERLRIGDEGTLTFIMDTVSQELSVAITGIGVGDKDGMVEIFAELPPGSYPTGISAKWAHTKQSEQYPVCLPLSALRSDAQDYVLVLREKQTVMGTEQTVSKVPVTVNARDSEQMAVTAPALGYDDQVVISASKPITEGDRVRLEEKKS